MKNIPIKLVEFREQDFIRKRGYDPDHDPAFVLHGDSLNQHCKTLIESFESRKACARVKFESQYSLRTPYVLSATLNGDATAKSYRGNVSAILDIDEREAVIGIRGSRELLVAVSSMEHFNSIGTRLQANERMAVGLSAIESIQGFNPGGAETEINEGSAYKIKILRFDDEDVDAAVHNHVLSMIGEDGGFCDISDNERMYRVSGGKARLIKDALLEEGLLLSIRQMPMLRIVTEAMATKEEIQPKAKNASLEYPRLGILDSGVAHIPQLDEWIVGRNRHFADDDRDPMHGTAVASVAMYGDALENKDWVGNNRGLEIFDGQVFPKDYQSVEEIDLIRNIEELLDEEAEYTKVWNLSVGINDVVKDDELSDLAKALDRVQKKHNILICKAAGNCPDSVKTGVAERLRVGGDSLMAITVGSVAHKKNTCDIAEVGNASPFSCKGPGVGFTVKPEVAHYGGNAGVSSSGAVLHTGIFAIDNEGQKIDIAGTSFASPRVAALASELKFELGDQADPLLLKALIIHSAKYPNGNCTIQRDIEDEMGYGVPSAKNLILHDGLNESTLVFQGEMRKGVITEVHQFEMPSSLVKDGYYSGQILITLVADPILDSSQGFEYCQSTIDVGMGTYDHEEEITDRMGSLIRLIDRKGVLAPSNYTKSIKKFAPDFNSERSQIQNNGKYWPVKKYAVDLSEMKASSKEKLLKANRKWFLKLDSLYRYHTERKAVLQDSTVQQRYCLVVTVRGDGDNARVNDEMAQYLTNSGFVFNPIEIKSEVRLQIMG